MMKTRAYFFGNMYLSQIQHGIQAAHVVTEMFTQFKSYKYSPMLTQWAEQDKTMILLNGGPTPLMYETLELMKNPHNHYPWACFYEPFLDDALTSIGIILPEEVYDTSKISPKHQVNNIISNKYDWDDFMSFHLQKHGLA